MSSPPNSNPATPPPNLSALLFRRQFLLGPRPFRPNEQWHSQQLDTARWLSTHPDLPVTIARSGDTLVALLGIALDPFHPSRSQQQIVDDLAARADSTAAAHTLTEPLSGRWALLFQRSAECAIFHDPAGLRQIYYTTGTDELWCGSQPAIIHAVYPLTPSRDPTLLAFLQSPDFERNESAWIGPRTIYDNCRRLLPNKILHLNSAREIRYFPSALLPALSLDEAAASAASLLTGTFDALCRRASIMLPITAGWESRVLLAAGREHLPSMYCYVDRMGFLTEDSYDVQIPSRLACKLNLPFTLENSFEEVPQDIAALLGQNVTGARLLPKTRAINAKLQRAESRININGNVSEICRNYFIQQKEEVLPDPLTAAHMSRLCGYPGSPFAQTELDSWLSDLGPDPLPIPLLDLLYWEQRLGTWGGHYPAEQDIAVDEISPFNNRRLLLILLSTPQHHRMSPGYVIYKEIIRRLWPELLSEPIVSTHV